MKLLITVIILGAIMRIPVNERIRWLQDTSCILVVTISILFPFGEWYGVTLLVTLILMTVMNLTFNIKYDKYDNEVEEERRNKVNELNFTIFNLEEELREALIVKRELEEYKKKNLNTASTLIQNIFNLLDEGEINSKELTEVVSQFMEILEHPIVVRRSSYDLNIECINNSERRFARKQLRNINKEYRLGKEFEMQINEMISKLETEMT